MNTDTEYKQVCVWMGTTLGDNTPDDFVKFIADTFGGTRAKFICEDRRSGQERVDLVFYVNSEDIGKFAVPRLAYGIRWLEDVMNNDPCYIPPKGVERCW
jgi:hypothetical protein